ncbi:MAG: hypothetical protein IJB69_06410 [Clostridia bacterium]|nr:hypothetical protein [Clostridia bacterium]
MTRRIRHIFISFLRAYCTFLFHIHHWEVSNLHCRTEESVYEKTYPGGGQLLLRIIGAVLIGAGVLILIFCIPGWAWLSLIGIVLIVAGVLLILRS